MLYLKEGEWSKDTAELRDRPSHLSDHFDVDFNIIKNQNKDDVFHFNFRILFDECMDTDRETHFNH